MDTTATKALVGGAVAAVVIFGAGLVVSLSDDDSAPIPGPSETTVSTPPVDTTYTTIYPGEPTLPDPHGGSPIDQVDVIVPTTAADDDGD